MKRYRVLKAAERDGARDRKKTRETFKSTAG
jgi:hypothetical protein